MRRALDELENLERLDTILNQDVYRCVQAFEEVQEAHPGADIEELPESQFWLRVFVRSFFALVEGITYEMRQAAIRLSASGALLLSPAEYVVLAEKRYYWRGGRVEVRESYNSVLDNLEIAFAFFSRGLGVDFQLDTSVHGYESFCAALKLRNSITHPKAPEDLVLSPQVIEQIMEAAKWFSTQRLRMTKAHLDHLKASMARNEVREGGSSNPNKEA